jgi:hypothetical protein
MNGQEKLLYMTGMFVACLLVANIIAGKLVSVLGLLVPVAVFAYPITFLITDVVGEVWGKKTAKTVVWTGFLANIVMLALIYVAINYPPVPFYENQEAFRTTLGMTYRIVFASMVAYLVSQHHDVFNFHFLRVRTKGRHLWLRNNASTMVSQLMDSVIFVSIAFYGITPVIPIIAGQYAIKLIIAALDTPLCYLATHLVDPTGEMRTASHPLAGVA